MDEDEFGLWLRQSHDLESFGQLTTNTNRTEHHLPAAPQAKTWGNCRNAVRITAVKRRRMRERRQPGTMTRQLYLNDSENKDRPRQEWDDK